MNKCKRMLIDIYRCDFYLIIGDVNFGNKKLDRLCCLNGDPLEDGYGGMTVFDDSGQLIAIYLPGWECLPSEIRNLVHESVHAASLVLNTTGVEHDIDNQEPLTYLTDTIFYECYNQLNKWINK